MRGAERRGRAMRKRLLTTDKGKTGADGRAAALPRLPKKSHSLCEQVKDDENRFTIKKDIGYHRAAGERKENKLFKIVARVSHEKVHGIRSKVGLLYFYGWR